ncbi:MAG: DUF3365 domain-containing protein [Gammaproteobacteria bacterium]|nr:DUF3365 domain-containing protein [Gammaproteobacteria bacterium]
MKQILLGLFLVTLALNSNADQHSRTSDQADIADAKAAIKDFAGSLQKVLKTTMQAGGPVAAIGACNTQASPISQTVAAKHGMALSRVSLQTRNPANAPNVWQTLVLEEFEKQHAAGKNTATLAWSETVNTGGEQEFRFMKAIPTGAACLNCHGTNISADVSGVLANLYPEDKATGFSEGDIRGAFVVTRKVQTDP